MYLAKSADLPKVGEHYSFDDLFSHYPGYWVLLAYPTYQEDIEEWSSFDSPGILVALEIDGEDLWRKRREYVKQYPDTMLYQFATDYPEDAEPPPFFMYYIGEDHAT